MQNEHFDVLIVGAGLSGIGAGYHLQEKCPGKSYVILEGRDCIGGTWDLFRYPGIRSDSRHVHARLFVQAVDRAEGDRRRAADPELRPRDRRSTTASTGRSASTIASSARRGRRRRRAGPWRPSARWARARPRSCASPAISCSCARAITNTRKATRRNFPARADFAGQHRASAEMARGSRLCRQARGGDRLGRDRRDAGAGNGQDRRARHHAAALADLCGGAAGGGCARQQAAAEISPPSSPIT